MKRISTIILLMAMMFAWTLNAQVDTIVTASGELGNSGSDLEFLNESGGLTRFPRLSDAGELLYYPPLVATDSVTNITSTSAMIYGNILFNGWYENVQEQGFQLSTTTDFSGSVTTQAISPENPYADCELPCVENVYSFIFTGLTPITTYYVRAYATNEEGIAYGDILQFTTLFGCGLNTVRDYDGNVYNTVQIGSQCWTKENLKTTHYMNGTAIPLGSTASTTVAYRYNPNNDAANVATYGYLYNWPAVMNGEASSNTIPSGVQGICPDGWHVPSDREWQEMEFAAGMSASDTALQQYRGNIAARLCGNTGWQASSLANSAGDANAENRNSTNFSACPAGTYGGSYTVFGNHANFWSSTEASASHTYKRSLFYDHVNVLRNDYQKNHGFSVRCIHDIPVPLGELPLVTTNMVTDITSTTATCGGNVVYEGSSAVTARGVCWSTSANPTVRDSHSEDGSGQGSFVSTLTNLISGTTYYVRAYAINSADTAYGEEVSFTSFACGTSTVTDYDGNVYNTVQIGSQCWTKENMKTTHYMNGTAIPLGSTTSTTVAYRYNPNNDAANVATYGYLYNWPAIMNGEASSNAIPSGVQGICPTGWHVPSDREWQEMEFAVGMSASDTVRQQFRGNIVARLCGNTGWSSSSVANAAGNTSAENRNSTGFSACPAGYYNAGSSTGFGQEAEYWTATMYNSDSSFRRDCIYSNVGINRTAFNKNRGFSVRCVHNMPVSLGELPLVTTNIVTDITSTTATCGGNVVDGGSSAVTVRGVCWSISENPTIEDSHTADGSGQGSFVSTMTNLTAGTTYYVRAYAINSADTVYGEEVSFTAIKVPTVTTTSISSIASTTATSGGNVTDDGGATVTARGVCWSASHNPTISNSKTTNGTGTGSFTSSMTGLTAGTTYFVRAYATNSAGTAYGNEVSFTTTIPDGSSCGTCRDYDGNNYSTVQIGNQCWMKSNLRTKHYADGTAIQAYVQGNPSTPYTTPYYYSFKYAVSGSALNASTYGYGYNGTAAMKNASSSNSNPSGVQGICPNGWHLPSRAEWNQLINYVQSQSQYLCGTSGIAAALATSGWGDPGSSHTCSVGRNANNATGFSARPTDYTSVCNPYCYDYGYRTYFVTSTLNGQYNYCVKILDTSVNPSFVSDSSGGAVRCVKD